MNRANLVRLALIVVITGLALAAVLVPEYEFLGRHRGDANTTLGMSLGLDLAGGIHLVYQADLSRIGDEDPARAMEGVRDILVSRVNASGLSAAVIQIQGKERISIQLPGISDIESAVELIGSTAELEFREILRDASGLPAQGNVAFILGNVTLTEEDAESLADDLGERFDSFKEINGFFGGRKYALVFKDDIARADVERELDDLGYESASLVTVNKVSYFDAEPGEKQDPYFWVPALGLDDNNNITALTGGFLKRNSRVVLDPRTNQPQVAFEFDDVGARLFGQITGRLINKPLGIFLDGKLVSDPIVRSKIEDAGVIENIPLDRARNMAILLNAGALPVPLGHFLHGNFVSGPAVQDAVDPTLGADSISKSVTAAMIGLALVLLFMVIFYRVPGVIAGCALIVYGILVLSVFKVWPVTLTLAGIAAFILSIGMAVDANILIFERLKEELRAGRTLGAAIEAGFNRAWSAIRDSNITTLIICGVLYWMGSNFAEPRVMGFALTLAVGVALSMFTAIFVTRTFLRLYVSTEFAKRTQLFGIPGTRQAGHSLE
ncbi:MAG: protein translocase subunit SecD [Dehalococcoidia bacterium]|nr:protein translocase subunit SecD [Dehalococcoidia bacterium]